MVKVPVVHALVDRGRMVINVRVPAHEIDVLRAVHGDMEVKVQGQALDDDDEPMVATLHVGAESEFARLQRKYPPVKVDDKFVNPVAAAFRGPRDLERVGFKSGVLAPQEVDVGIRRGSKKAKDGKARKAA